MALYIFIDAVLVLEILGFLLLRRWNKKSVYHFKSVALTGGLFGLGFLLLDLFLHMEEGSRDGAFLWQLVRTFPVFFSTVAVILFAILGLLMFVSNLELIRREGFRPKNMVGTFLGVIYIGATVAVYLLSRWLTALSATMESPFAGFLCSFLPLFFYCLLDYVECITFGIMVMGYVASRQKPRYDKDYIIILGCSISKTGGLLPLLKGRVSRAIRYAWDQELTSGKPLRYVPSGGQGPDEIMSEGSAMELFLISHGAEPYEVLPERKSGTTAENFRFSAEIIRKENPDAQIAFATTNYHMLRAGMIAHKQGMELEGIASTTKWYFWPNGFAREVVAIFAMNKKKHLFFVFLCYVAALFCTYI